MLVMQSRRWVFLLIIPLVLILILAFNSRRIGSSTSTLVSPPSSKENGRHPIYKPITPSTYDPIVETFPLAASARTSDDIPRPPAWLQPPVEHVAETTPLLIGFTRDWPVLQQAVVSYISAGWPPEDIYVVDNSGVQFSNVNKRLTLQNPAYIDHARLTDILGINVIVTPTLLTFAQLQNFFLFTAQQRHWPNYFWSHMDVVAQSDEAQSPFKSLYRRAVDVLRDANNCASSKSSTRCVKEEDRGKPWALRFFRYDLLALVNTEAYRAVGGWDTAIPFYKSDCDMHFRLSNSGFSVQDAFIGHVYDVGRSLPDVRRLLRENTTDCEKEEGTQSRKREYTVRDCRYRSLRATLEGMQHDKLHHEGGRNYWQGRQEGGEGEPFWRHPLSTRRGFQAMDDLGQRLFGEKWGHRDCDLKRQGLKPSDAWKVKPDWIHEEDDA